MDGMDSAPRIERTPFSPIGALHVPAEQAARPAALLSFVSLFRPVRAIDTPKRRVGSVEDGGYVMLDDFGGPSLALSLGVGEDTSWDRDMAEAGAIVHQYDHTVPSPTGQPAAIRFFQKEIVNVADGVGATLLEATETLEAEGRDRPAYLKIDIEGAEWAVLDAAPDAVLERFDQIVCEYHDFERMADAAWLQRASRVASKLNRSFEVVHVHGNNHRPILVVGGAVFPWVLEVTYARRERFRFEATNERFPTRLDRPNHPHRPDLWLGSFAFGEEQPVADTDGGEPMSVPNGGGAPGDRDARRNGVSEDVAGTRGIIAALAAERAQMEDQHRPLRGYVDALRARERELEAQYNRLEAETQGVHRAAQKMQEDAASSQAEAARAYDAVAEELRRSTAARAEAALAYGALREELRLSTAARATLDEDARRSRSAAQEAQDRYAALAADFEANLQALAASRARFAEVESRLGSEASLLTAARAEIERLLSELQTVGQGRQSQAVRMAELQASIDASIDALAGSEARASRAEARCRALESSSSWRMTRPMRVIMRYVRR